MSKKSKIPDRWQAYSNMGEVIKGTTIVPIKVPLRESLSTSLSSEERFSPSVLLTLVQEKGLKLGGVVDLTYTTKYYDAQFFTTNDIGYRKVFVAGHVIPSEQNFDQFASAIKSLEKEGEVICVHCTHGLNRSGYMICRYMIEVLNIKPKRAIRLFEKARGHKMERQNYIDDLMSRTPGTKTVAECGPGDSNGHIPWGNSHPGSSHPGMMEDGSNSNYHPCHRRDRAMAWRGRKQQRSQGVSHDTPVDRQHITFNSDGDIEQTNASTSSHGNHRTDDTGWNSGYDFSHQRQHNTDWRGRGREYGYNNNSYHWQRDDGGWNQQRHGYDRNDMDSQYDFRQNGGDRNYGPYSSGRSRGGGMGNNTRGAGRSHNNNWSGRGKRNEGGNGADGNEFYWGY